MPKQYIVFFPEGKTMTDEGRTDNAVLAKRIVGALLDGHSTYLPIDWRVQVEETEICGTEPLTDEEIDKTLKELDLL